MKKSNMKIYFAGSIRGGREDMGTYLEIIRLLGAYGQVLTEHIGDKNLTDRGEVHFEDTYIYERDMAWLRSADAIVADVTAPSVGVGYEIAYGETLGKKVLCLYREGAEKRISGMISGNKNLTNRTYKTIADIPEILKGFFA